ncbi:MAG TPA: glycine oxidase ThiO [Candidatus Sulfotelmatobacter sp.]|nr:glycine oxidase ThiO [Candidatus Sulfotelmatobacter sp.]
MPFYAVVEPLSSHSVAPAPGASQRRPRPAGCDEGVSPRTIQHPGRILLYNFPVKSWDIIIVGGGIIGLSLSIAIRKRGATVLVVERGEPGREASHAAGGMLVDCPLETPPILQPLATASAHLYPEFAHELEVESGMKVDLRDNGTILFLSDEHASAATFPRADVAQLEPALAEANPGTHAIFLHERSVDPRALTAAAIKTAKNRGVDFSSGDPVTAVHQSENKITGVKTIKTSFAAHKVVNCAGAWAGAIAPVALPTRPVKGQMLCLVLPSHSLLQHVVRSPKVYLIPRTDGRLLIGATVEEAGFDKRTVASTIQRQHHSALALLPKLSDAKILEDWAGLRPGTPDGLPILGQTDVPGYYVATGHYRDGILLAPITAQVMADVIEGRSPAHDLTPFSPARF